MNIRETSQSVFNNEDVHSRWISAYRDNELQDAFNKLMLDDVLTIMRLPEGAHILDAGCGTGDHSFRLAQHNLNVVGVDLSEMVLQQSRATAKHKGLNAISFLQSDLTDLSRFSDSEFDAIHCRGVLMHIPDWKKAVAELCRILKPGGLIALFENNHLSLELKLVRFFRFFRNSDSIIHNAPGGVEFHPVNNASSEPLTRVANISHLVNTMQDHGVSLLARHASEFWDIARWPKGRLRNLIIRFNQTWYSWHLPAQACLGNIIVGRKKL